MSKKNSNETIGNWTCNLPACSTVPQSTLPLCAPRSATVLTWYDKALQTLMTTLQSVPIHGVECNYIHPKFVNFKLLEPIIQFIHNASFNTIKVPHLPVTSLASVTLSTQTVNMAFWWHTTAACKVTFCRRTRTRLTGSSCRISIVSLPTPFTVGTTCITSTILKIEMKQSQEVSLNSYQGIYLHIHSNDYE